MNVIASLIVALLLGAFPLEQLPATATQTKENLSVPIKDLRNAPTTVVVNNRSLHFSTYLWRDFAPGASGPGGSPLMVALRVSSADKQLLPSGIRMDRAWVLFGEQAWEVAVRGRKMGDDKDVLLNCPATPVCEISVHGGPKWGPGVYVDVVLRLVDSEGQEYFLQATRQRIESTS